MDFWMHLMARVPLWTIQAHLPQRSALDELTEENPEDQMAMRPAIAPKWDKKAA